MVDTIELNATHRLIASDRVEGTSVYNGDNEKLGSIRNIMINKKSGKAEYAVLEFGGFFGLAATIIPSRGICSPTTPTRTAMLWTSRRNRSSELRIMPRTKPPNMTTSMAAVCTAIMA